ncbi:hypothetical protein BST95_07770 [Halioglobus japonicus]|uniref:Uncharacterized protein n=1 Tax=Halioglobus japonicus TaxID=930805 RepID=A0AAP8MEU3_9GAMM|nr:hypothetical protein [Halioglobus japonicus]AQA18152.1 hypothetical protein BST95_07770 [Halioglobus japonicus]PLW86149.1 hypothetical protein C0029_06810 [Halioglobus japonicus]GHD14192.1 hypothetical protein GCM10007052_17660 [Halioglobus japonicus]
MSIWNKTFTLDQLVQEAKKAQKKYVQQVARHLCLREGIDPQGKTIASFIAREICSSNEDAVVIWLRDYLLENDLLPMDADLTVLEREFHLLLLDRLPPHMIGGYE